MPKKLDEYELLEDFKKEYTNHIIKFRIDNNMSQQEFADYVGLKQQSISRIENGISDIRISTLIKILACTKKRIKIGGNR